MADIQFQEPEYARPLPGAGRRSWLTGLVIKTGLATDDAGAQKVLIVVLVLTIIATVAVFLVSGNSVSSSQEVPVMP